MALKTNWNSVGPFTNNTAIKSYWILTCSISKYKIYVNWCTPGTCLDYRWIFALADSTFGRQIIKALKRDGNMMLEWKKITLDSNRNDYCKSWSVTHQMMAETRRNWLTYELLYKKNLKGYIACNVVLKYTYHTTTPIVSGLKFMQLWYFAL